MEVSRVRYKVNAVYPNVRSANLKYWERLQKVMDAAKTVVSSNELRRRSLENNKKANYQNEYDRLRSEISHMKPELQKVAIQNMLGDYNMVEKMKVLGVYDDIKKSVEPKDAPIVAPSEAPTEAPTVAPRERKKPGRPKGSKNKLKPQPFTVL